MFSFNIHLLFHYSYFTRKTTKASYVQGSSVLQSAIGFSELIGTFSSLLICLTISVIIYVSSWMRRITMGNDEGQPSELSNEYSCKSILSLCSSFSHTNEMFFSKTVFFSGMNWVFHILLSFGY